MYVDMYVEATTSTGNWIKPLSDQELDNSVPRDEVGEELEYKLVALLWECH